jgi:hypothetical protein
LRPERFELLLRVVEHAGEPGAGGFEVSARLGIVVAHLLVHAHLFKLHVELEGLFKEVGRGDLLFLCAGGAGGVGRGTRLLLELNAFEREKIFSSRNGVAQGTIGAACCSAGGREAKRSGCSLRDCA